MKRYGTCSNMLTFMLGSFHPDRPDLGTHTSRPQRGHHRNPSAWPVYQRVVTHKSRARGTSARTLFQLSQIRDFISPASRKKL
jgi:hypothetical protein